MRVAVCGIVVACVLAVSAAPALARPFGQGREGLPPGNGGFGHPAQREMSREMQPRPDFQRNNLADERMQRLSPDERRQLRRDIRDAGREIYRPRY